MGGLLESVYLEDQENMGELHLKKGESKSVNCFQLTSEGVHRQVYVVAVLMLYTPCIMTRGSTEFLKHVSAHRSTV